MRVLGVEMNSDKMYFVVVDSNEEGEPTLYDSGKLQLFATREKAVVKDFSLMLEGVLRAIKPDLIMVKSKPESGRMRAGAACSVMETVLLLTASCDVRHVSPQKLAKIEDNTKLFSYLKGAWKAGVSGMNDLLN